MPTLLPRTTRRNRPVTILAAALALFLLAPPAEAADLAECERQLRAGEYEACVQTAAAAITELGYGESWYTTKARAELTLGRHADADATVLLGLKRYRSSVRLRLLAREAALFTGRSEEGAAYLVEIADLHQRMAWNFTAPADLVAIGRAALISGSDARQVLETFYQPALDKRTSAREPLLAIGELALAKNDAQLAAENFTAATKQFEDEPDAWFGLGRALIDEHADRAAVAFDRALALNPRHLPTLLYTVEKLVDGERYDTARETLQTIAATNPRLPEAFAYRALIAELEQDPRGHTLFRDAALATWGDNPHVDHLIGRKLSAKYRFAEGAAHQRLALELDENFEPARVQLAQDLLRLGNDAEGWATAKAAHERDGYDVTTFNLLELHDELERFVTLENEHFLLRMERTEAEVYGRRALRLLEEARSSLGEKYGLLPEGRIVVEIFPNPDDFGVRTFGIPAVGGYLGVCFGRVITANSPASRKGSPSNWEAVLWHEFAHVVTLELTHNRIPRWLSEGISVHEELQRDPTWGQRMNARYREMVLDGELTPIAELSSAFTSPEDGLHLQFAYYQSALVVEYLTNTFGLESLRNVLGDVGNGLPVNVALERRCDSMPFLEAGFAEFARKRAESFGPRADWSDPDLDVLRRARDREGLERFLEANPDNVQVLTAYAELLAESAPDAARTALEHLIALCPDHPAAYRKLATIHRAANDTTAERAALRQLVHYEDDALPEHLRLLELAAAEEDFATALEHGDRALAIDPLISSLHRSMAAAAARTGDEDRAIDAHRALLALDTDDPAGTHYELARLLHRRGDPAAREHVLRALEQAPRFRAAHALLLEIRRTTSPTPPDASPAAPPSVP